MGACSRYCQCLARQVTERRSLFDKGSPYAQPYQTMKTSDVRKLQASATCSIPCSVLYSHGAPNLVMRGREHILLSNGTDLLASNQCGECSL